MNQIATTIEQSKHLIELGLDASTADMNYSISEGGFILTAMPFVEGFGNLPAWSLGALLELMPYRTELVRTLPYSKVMQRDVWDGQFIFISYPEGLEINKHVSDFCDTPIEAAYNMVVWLLDNNYIKTK